MADDDARAGKLLAQEEELFQTARLINCGWFGSAVFSDYFSAILGLVRQGSSWSLNPFGVRLCGGAWKRHGLTEVCGIRKYGRRTIRCSSAAAATCAASRYARPPCTRARPADPPAAVQLPLPLARDDLRA